MIRLALFGVTLAAMMLWEFAAPRRGREAGRAFRWAQNIGLQVADTAVVLGVNLAVPILAVDAARRFESWRWGLLHHVGWPFWAKTAAGLVFLDMVIYFQHWSFHVVPAFWRFHKIHHTDVDIDATSGVRFHPVEILLSLGIKLAAIALSGAGALAVLIFELSLNLGSLFNHANVRIPARLEPWLRALIVTPDMHRVHHSVRARETNSNYSFNLSCWDRLFGTYNAEPADGHAAMRLGLPEYRDWAVQHLGWLLALPFR